MDWKNSRIDALLEQALMEDKAAGDTTTNLTINSGLGELPLLLLEKARAALDNLNKGR